MESVSSTNNYPSSFNTQYYKNLLKNPFMAAIIEITNIPKDNIIQTRIPEDEFDYSQRAQWLRAAVLGANDGLVSTASLMVGIGAVKNEATAMILTGFAGLFAGSCSMAIGEFVSVYSQRDIELSQMKRGNNNNNNNNNNKDEDEEKERLPNPFQAAMASALAFALGAIVPILAAAFIEEHKVRVVVVACAVSLALLVFGGVGAVLGKTPKLKPCVRVLVGGWMAMGITFGLTKLVGFSGLEM